MLCRFYYSWWWNFYNQWNLPLSHSYLLIYAPVPDKSQVFPTQSTMMDITRYLYTQYAHTCRTTFSSVLILEFKQAFVEKTPKQYKDLAQKQSDEVRTWKQVHEILTNMMQTEGDWDADDISKIRQVRRMMEHSNHRRAETEKQWAEISS